MSRSRPFVSIICPIYNSEKYVRTIAPSLSEQSYPRENYEILFIDNGSTDRTVERLGEYPVRVLERTDVRSSYAARNLGIQESRGEILAFIDADCRADRFWLERGVESIAAGRAGLTAGRVEFSFHSRRSAAEWLDSLSHMDNEASVRRHRCAQTANLFVSGEVFRQIGRFDERFQSGGDLEFTRRATDSGLLLDYCSDATVFHPTRRLAECIVKQFRVGGGQPLQAIRKGGSSLERLLFLLRNCFVPRNPYRIYKKIKKQKSLYFVYRILAVNLTLKAVQALGIAQGLLREIRKSRHQRPTGVS